MPLERKQNSDAVLVTESTLSKGNCLTVDSAIKQKNGIAAK